MKKEEFLDLVNRYYTVLMETYGFSLVYSSGPWGFGDYSVVLESGDCHVQIETERGSVVISGGLRYAPFHYDYPGQWVVEPLTSWYNIWYVISYLSGGRADWKYPEDTMPQDDRRTSVEKQMKVLAKLLEPHWGEVVDFFQESRFVDKQKDLERFIDDIITESGYGAPYPD